MPDERGKRYYWKTKDDRLAKNKQWRDKNREHIREYSALRRFLKYGLDLETYNKLVAVQDNSCPICRRTFDGKSIKPCIDHDHKTGSVRWVICQGCNKGLGWFEDNPWVMRRAVMYVESFTRQPRDIRVKK